MWNPPTFEMPSGMIENLCVPTPRHVDVFAHEVFVASASFSNALEVLWVVFGTRVFWDDSS